MVLLADLAQEVAALLSERGETIAIAESSAGGLISAALLRVPGASAYFLGGGVIYTRAARAALLGITDETMTGLRGATEPYALLLARTTRERFGASWSLAETGATGPSGNRYGDPPGHACFAVSGPLEAAVTLDTGSADRAANMERFAEGALALLQKSLTDAGG